MRKPKNFDYNLIVIGAGSAGLVTSYIGAVVNAKVALIEKHKMGGDCLNTGCVPSKALIKSAKAMHIAKNSSKYGIKKMDVDFDFKEVMNRVQSVIKDIEPHDSIERYTNLGVECITGEAQIKSPWHIEVNNKVLTTKNIVIATGARPLVIPFKGLEDVNYVTSDNLWNLETLPKKFLVLGGGPIGCEIAQCFARFGSKVTIVDKAKKLMGKEDPEVSEVIEQTFKEESIDIKFGASAKEFKREGEKQVLITENEDGSTSEIEFDVCLLAMGRRPNTEGFGLKELGVELNKNGTVKTDPYLRTIKYKNIYACGDVAGPYQFTHTASHQAWFVSVNSLFSPYKKKADYSVIPWATFTDPEVAHVGHTEESAKEANIKYETTTYHLDDLDRAIADSAIKGFVKVLTPPGGRDKILGATIVGQNASDMLLEYTAAMKHGFGLNKIMGTIHPYPTMGEGNKFAASTWKNKNKPEGLLKFLRKFHTWRRG